MFEVVLVSGTILVSEPVLVCGAVLVSELGLVCGAVLATSILEIISCLHQCFSFIYIYINMQFMCKRGNYPRQTLLGVVPFCRVFTVIFFLSHRNKAMFIS